MADPWSNQAVTLILLSEQTQGFSGMFGYSPSPGAGNLIFSVAAAAGTDPYGNTYPQGISGFGTLTLFGPTAALLIYSGTPAKGNLIGSWAGQAGTDSFGNIYPTGINANQGSLTGVSLINPSVSTPTITSGSAASMTITVPTITGGTITETAITFDTSGGTLLVYGSSTTTVTQTVNGNYTFTGPAGVTSAKIECWGAGAGAGGGSSTRGGEGGGGGEYGQNPAYPLVPGTVYSYTVGQGGQGGITGVGGTGGGDSFFDFSGAGGGVIAEGGLAGSGFIGGVGGFYGLAPIAEPGGNGGGTGSQGTGGCGGGGSGGATGAGGQGNTSGSSTGATGGSAGTGGGAAGGNGGNNGANGNNGNAPGAGGGGCGSGSATNTFTKTYHLNSSGTYYGSDANASAPPNGVKNSTATGDGTMVQGGETASGGSFNGVMKSMGIWPYTTIESDLSGATITSVTLRLENLHSWFNSGMSIALGYTNNTSLPSSYGGSSTSIGTYSIAEGAIKTFTLPNSYGTALQNGNAKTIVIGPGPGSISNPNLSYYGYFYGAGGDNNQNPLLSVSGKTGSGSNTAGNGADGQVKITYTSGQTLLGSIAAVAGTDGFGNAYPAGIAGVSQGTDYVSLQTAGTNAAVTWGTVSTAQDASIVRNGVGSLLVQADVLLPTGSQINFTGTGGGPFIANEGFHTCTLPAGLSGTVRVKKLPWNAVWLDVQVTGTPATYTCGTVPDSSYAPIITRTWALSNNLATTAGNVARIFFGAGTGGPQIIITGAAGGTGTCGAEIMFPTN